MPASRSLEENSIGDAGAAELAAALKTNTTLTTLYLASACRSLALGVPSPRRAAAHALSPRAARPSARGRPLAPRRARVSLLPLLPRSLRTAGNDIGAAGATELAAALKTNASLVTLNLISACRRSMGVGPRDAHALARRAPPATCLVT